MGCVLGGIGGEAARGTTVQQARAGERALARVFGGLEFMSNQSKDMSRDKNSLTWYSRRGTLKIVEAVKEDGKTCAVEVESFGSEK